MFFRSKPTTEYTFSERISMLREARFRIQEPGQSGGSIVAIRDGYAAAIENKNDSPEVRRSGRIINKELAVLVSHGYQTTWRTPSGHEEAATAGQLERYHAFLEDLRELLGQTSLYNQSLGTTHSVHDYDRVAGREPRRRPSAEAQH